MASVSASTRANGAAAVAVAVAVAVMAAAVAALTAAGCADAPPDGACEGWWRQGGARSDAWRGAVAACARAPACPDTPACDDPRWPALADWVLDGVAACFVGPCEERAACVAALMPPATCRAGPRGLEQEELDAEAGELGRGGVGVDPGIERAGGLEAAGGLGLDPGGGEGGGGVVEQAGADPGRGLGTAVEGRHRHPRRVAGAPARQERLADHPAGQRGRQRAGGGGDQRRAQRDGRARSLVVEREGGGVAAQELAGAGRHLAQPSLHPARDERAVTAEPAAQGAQGVHPPDREEGGGVAAGAGRRLGQGPAVGGERGLAAGDGELGGDELAPGVEGRVERGRGQRAGGDEVLGRGGEVAAEQGGAGAAERVGGAVPAAGEAAGEGGGRLGGGGRVLVVGRGGGVAGQRRQIGRRPVEGQDGEAGHAARPRTRDSRGIHAVSVSATVGLLMSDGRDIARPPAADPAASARGPVASAEVVAAALAQLERERDPVTAAHLCEALGRLQPGPASARLAAALSARTATGEPPGVRALAAWALPVHDPDAGLARALELLDEPVVGALLAARVATHGGALAPVVDGMEVAVNLAVNLAVSGEAPGMAPAVVAPTGSAAPAGGGAEAGGASEIGSATDGPASMARELISPAPVSGGAGHGRVAAPGARATALAAVDRAWTAAAAALARGDRDGFAAGARAAERAAVTAGALDAARALTAVRAEALAVPWPIAAPELAFATTLVAMAGDPEAGELGWRLLRALVPALPPAHPLVAAAAALGWSPDERELVLATLAAGDTATIDVVALLTGQPRAAVAARLPALVGGGALVAGPGEALGVDALLAAGCRGEPSPLAAPARPAPAARRRAGDVAALEGDGVVVVEAPDAEVALAGLGAAGGEALVVPDDGGERALGWAVRDARWRGRPLVMTLTAPPDGARVAALATAPRLVAVTGSPAVATATWLGFARVRTDVRAWTPPPLAPAEAASVLADALGVDPALVRVGHLYPSDVDALLAASAARGEAGLWAIEQALHDRARGALAPFVYDQAPPLPPGVIERARELLAVDGGWGWQRSALVAPLSLAAPLALALAAERGVVAATLALGGPAPGPRMVRALAAARRWGAVLAVGIDRASPVVVAAFARRLAAARVLAVVGLRPGTPVPAPLAALSATVAI